MASGYTEEVRSLAAFGYNAANKALVTLYPNAATKTLEVVSQALVATDSKPAEEVKGKHQKEESEVSS